MQLGPFDVLVPELADRQAGEGLGLGSIALCGPPLLDEIIVVDLRLFPVLDLRRQGEMDLPAVASVRTELDVPAGGVIDQGHRLTDNLSARGVLSTI
jgi:hypothetical protein